MLYQELGEVVDRSFGQFIILCDNNEITYISAVKSKLAADFESLVERSVPDLNLSILLRCRACTHTHTRKPAQK
jgi:hypothetical protein